MLDKLGRIINIDKIEDKISKAEKYFDKHQDEDLEAGYTLQVFVKGNVGQYKYRDLYDKFEYDAEDSNDVGEAMSFLDTLTEEILAFFSDNGLEPEYDIRVVEDDDDGNIVLKAFI